MTCSLSKILTKIRPLAIAGTVLKCVSLVWYSCYWFVPVPSIRVENVGHAILVVRRKLYAVMLTEYFILFQTNGWGLFESTCAYLSPSVHVGSYASLSVCNLTKIHIRQISTSHQHQVASFIKELLTRKQNLKG